MIAQVDATRRKERKTTPFKTGEKLAKFKVNGGWDVPAGRVPQREDSDRDDDDDEAHQHLDGDDACDGPHDQNDQGESSDDDDLERSSSDDDLE